MSVNSTLIEDFSEQYRASLKMIEDVIVKCKDELWQDYTQEVIISQLVYHCLGSADFNLCKTNAERDSFKAKYGNFDFPFNDKNKTFTKKQLSEYLNEIKEKADKLFKNITIDELANKTLYDFRGTISLYSSLENNSRHSMLHVGALHARLTLLGNESLPYINVRHGDERDILDELNNQGVAFILEGKIDDAEKIYLDLCPKSPNNPLYNYNFACVNSRKGNKQKALDTLQLCLKYDNGNKFKNLAKTDTDFNNIREIPQFQQLIS